MRKVKKSNVGIALAAAMILAVLTVKPDVAYGAIGIDTDAKCSITFDLSLSALVIQSEGQDSEGQNPEEPGDTPPTGQISAGFDELSSLPIEIELYKVADVNVSGKYVTSKTGSNVIYNALKTGLDNVSSRTTADEWLIMAENAVNVLQQSEGLTATAKTTLNKPTAGDGKTIGELSTGLYLVVAHEVMSDQYIYSFTPYLVSLPGNNYKEPGDNDEWKYDMTVSLKPSRVNRYGDLEIIKSLKTYNATLGGATCIFQIEAEKDGIVYSDVKSIVFDSAGSKRIKIEGKIPVGAVVTVTEVYSGASYKITSEPEQTETIAADKTVNVEFSNDYDERPNGGSSVVNHFVDKAAGDQTEGDTNSEGRKPVWVGEQLTDSSKEPQKSGGAAADEE